MKIGIKASACDLLHVGHILMLKEAKSVCDYLIVAIQIDPKLSNPEKISLSNLFMRDGYNYRQ